MTFASEVDNQTVGSSSAALAKTVTSGNHLVLAIAIRDGAAINSVTDSQGQTWTLAVTATDGSRRVAQYHCANAFTGSLTVTVGLAASDTTFLWLVEATKGAAVSVPGTDSTSTASGTSHPHGATGVDAISGDLLMTVAAQSSSLTDETPAAGYTAGSFTGGNGRQYWQRRVAAGTLTDDQGTYTNTTSHASVGCIAVYRDAAGGGARRRRLVA